MPQSRAPLRRRPRGTALSPAGGRAEGGGHGPARGGCTEEEKKGKEEKKPKKKQKRERKKGRPGGQPHALTHAHAHSHAPLAPGPGFVSPALRRPPGPAPPSSSRPRGAAPAFVSAGAEERHKAGPDAPPPAARSPRAAPNPRGQRRSAPPAHTKGGDGAAGRSRGPAGRSGGPRRFCQPSAMLGGRGAHPPAGARRDPRRPPRPSPGSRGATGESRRRRGCRSDLRRVPQPCRHPARTAGRRAPRSYRAAILLPSAP